MILHHLQCKTWNFPEEFRCARCGAYGDERNYHGDYQRADRRAYEEEQFGALSGQTMDEKEVDDVDEFGRSRPPPKPKAVPEWPPRFEQNGTDFVFDARSAMFYHSESDFFYDPKSKMYYGNKKGAYYRYQVGGDPPFEQVSTSPETSSLDPEPILGDRPNSGSSSGSKISIKLKTKTLKKSKQRVPPSPAAALPKAVEKTHAADIQKWTGRQQEKQSVAAKSVGDTQVATTAKGEPICQLCQRKFPTIEKLRYHEQVSKLHKDNVAKQQQALQAASKSTSDEKPAYVDRAQHRRTLYGTDATPAARPDTAEKSQHSHYSPAPPTTVQEPLGAGNVGHQMLKKLGWNGQKTAEQEALAKDWDRIERTSKGGSNRYGKRRLGVD